MRTFVFCGTESARVLCCELLDDGRVELADEVVTSDLVVAGEGYFAKTAGAPMVEWVEVHPSGKWLYAFVSFWEARPGLLRTFAVSDDGHLSEADGGKGLDMGGFQPCCAAWVGQLCAVGHYLSGTIEVFDARHGHAPKRVGLAQCPDQRSAAKPFSVDGFKAPSVGEVAPLCHGIATCPGWLVATDAGQGAVVSFRLDERSRAPLGSPTSYSLARPPVAGSAGQALAVASMGHRPRHVAFAAGGSMLLVLHECSNALTLHPFDPQSGAVGAALHAVASFGDGVRGSGCGVARALAAVLPVRVALCLALALGLKAAAEISVHPPSGRVVLSTRGLPNGSSLRSLAAQQPHSLAIVQDLPVRSNPRHLAFNRAGSTLVVGGAGGFDVLRVTPEGALAIKASSKLPPRLANIEIDCVALVEK